MHADPVTWSGTYTRLVALFDNYEPQLKTQETETVNETAEIESFLDEVLNSEICKNLEEFLIKKGGNH